MVPMELFILIYSKFKKYFFNKIFKACITINEGTNSEKDIYFAVKRIDIKE